MPFEDMPCVPKGILHEPSMKLVMESGKLLLEDLHHFSALMRMGEAAKEGTTLREVCKELVEILVQELPVTKASILLEERKGILRVMEKAQAQEELPPYNSSWDTQETLEIGRGELGSFLESALRSVRPHVQTLLERSPEGLEEIMVGIPMDVGGTRGLLCLERPITRQPEAREFSLWELLGHQVCLIMKLVRLLEKERRWGRKLEQRVRERTHRLEEINRQLTETQEFLMRSERLNSLGQMAAGIAHNFNNILATILGHTQLYRRKTADPAMQKCLEIIEKAAWNGAQIVQRIQSFAGGKINRSRRGPVSINTIITDVKRLTAPRWRDQAQKEGVNIRFMTELQEVPYIEGNGAELTEMLTNLIFNAIDAMPKGGQIRVSTRAHEEYVEILVSDTGVGIAPEDIGRIFDPFFTTKGPAHCGLGLSTVYGIVESHGGDVAVESNPNEGSQISVRLPIPREQADQAFADEGISIPEGGRSLGRILLVEDDEGVRETLQECLESLGEVQAVADVEDAGRVLAEKRFDLLVADLSLPDGSGLDVVEMAQGADVSIPVIIVTGWGKEVSDLDEDQLGIWRVFTKPFHLGDLQRAAMEAMRKSPTLKKGKAIRESGSR